MRNCTMFLTTTVSRKIHPFSAKEWRLNKVPNSSAGLKPSAKRAKPFGLKELINLGKKGVYKIDI
jgi:hypothetical protein